MAKIEELEGIGPVYAGKLQAQNITTIEQLLERGKTPKGRKELEELTGIEGKRLMTWINMADLCRIKGVGPQFSELLEAAGVDTIKELRHRRADNLQAKMAEVNEQKKLTRAVPTVEQVQGFINQAKEMEPGIEY